MGMGPIHVRCPRGSLGVKCSSEQKGHVVMSKFFNKVKSISSKVVAAAVKADQKYCAAWEKAEKAILEKVRSKHESLDSAVEKKVVSTIKDAATSTKSLSERVVKQYDKNDIYRGIGVGIVSGAITAVVGWQYGIGVLATYAVTDVTVKTIKAKKEEEESNA